MRKKAPATLMITTAFCFHNGSLSFKTSVAQAEQLSSPWL
jgi:hypothetical protein